MDRGQRTVPPSPSSNVRARWSIGPSKSAGEASDANRVLSSTRVSDTSLMPLDYLRRVSHSAAVVAIVQPMIAMCSGRGASLGPLTERKETGSAAGQTP